MARKKKRRRRKSKTVSALTIFGFATNFTKPAPSGRTILKDMQNGDLEAAMFDGREIFLGISSDGKLKLDWLLDTWMRPVAGFVGSKIATKIGLNRQFARLPVIGKFLKL